MPKKKPLTCPFCEEAVARPQLRMDLYSAEGSLAGQCDGCGAVFVVDETGRLGGQAVLDLQALACGGDLDRALKLEGGRDIEIHDMPIPAAALRSVFRTSAMGRVSPRAWFGRLLDSKE
jgi:hypothetical protein